ncbi:MAG TPA: SRPBCC domain-containing protein, partial [Methanomicrobiales archaeon]|nr:SRPBCC domain-containing protein [Methanomicrobiales archaeon]
MMKQPETAPGKGFRRMITIERTFRANAKDLWDLWTTREGLESWWGPEGFTMKVDRLEVRPGGRFEYEMTATAPEQMEALKRENLPLVSLARSTYTEI